MILICPWLIDQSGCLQLAFGHTKLWCTQVYSVKPSFYKRQFSPCFLYKFKIFFVSSNEEKNPPKHLLERFVLLFVWL